MRSLVLFLSLLGATLFVILVLLPVLGVILLVVAVALALALGVYLAAPLLVRLPWFRDRVTVEERGGRKTVRFDGAQFADDDVIDVEGRELPEKRDGGGEPLS